MNNKEKIEEIIKWQESPYTHELTCGDDNCAGILTPDERDGEVVLACYECNDYTQTLIPNCIFGVDYKKLAKPYEMLQEMRKKAEDKK